MSFQNNLEKAFKEQFPSFKDDKNDTAIAFTAQESNYRVYMPTYTHSNGQYHFQLKIDHIRGFAEDDHCTLTISTDETGTYIAAPTSQISLGTNGITEVVEWVGLGAELIFDAGSTIAISIISFLLAPETMGASVAVGLVTEAEALAAGYALNYTFQQFAQFSDQLADEMDDGGRAYFVDIIAHTTLRFQSALLEALAGEQFTRHLNFSFSNFQKAIGNGKYQSDQDGMAVTYRFDHNDYRSWKQDFTVSYENLGMVVSGKVDGIRGGTLSSDHLTLMVNFDRAGNSSVVQGTLILKDVGTFIIPAIMYGLGNQIVQMEAGTFTADSIEADSIEEAFMNVLDNTLRSIPNYKNLSSERKDFPTVAYLNLGWMGEAVQLGS